MSGGATDRGGAFASSKFWARHSADPTAKRQGGHSACCRARYPTAAGMPSESRALADGPPAFARADVAKKDVEDARTTDLEKRFKPRAAVELLELLNYVPHSQPIETDMVTRPI